MTSTSIILRSTQLNVVLALYTRMCADVSSLVPLIVVPLFSSNASATSDVCDFSLVLVLICIARGLALSVSSICNESNNLEGRYMPNKINCTSFVNTWINCFYFKYHFFIIIISSENTYNFITLDEVACAWFLKMYKL